MLIEIDNPRQNENERRRVFHDDYFDLYVWIAHDGAISGFQLCYDRDGMERALTWREKHGYSHEKVDPGEDIGKHFKMKPVLLADGLFDYRGIAERFREAGAGIDKNIAGFVHKKILEYGP